MRSYSSKSASGSAPSMDLRRQAASASRKASLASQLDFDAGYPENDFDIVSLDSLGVHLLFGEVDNWVIKDAVTFVLKANLLLQDDITIVLNTVGGDVAEGFGLIDVMEASRLNIRTVGMGNIISMGMLIICAGTPGKRVMMKNTTAMAHQFNSYATGKFHELIAQNESNLYTKEQFIIHFQKHTKMTKKQIEDIMFGKSDKYLSPAECKKYGLIDKIVDELPKF